MRRTVATAALTVAFALTLLFGSATALQAAPQAASLAAAPQALVAQTSAPPVFDDYLVCFNGWIYTDYVDPDGDDANLGVWVWIYRGASADGFWLSNSGPSVHGVFFYLELASIGINPGDITQMAFIGYDETGTWSANWTWSDGACNLS